MLFRAVLSVLGALRSGEVGFAGLWVAEIALELREEL